MNYLVYRRSKEGAFFKKIDSELPLCPFCAQSTDWLGMEICKGRENDTVAFLGCRHCGAEMYTVNRGDVLNFDGNLRVLNVGKRNRFRLEANKVYHVADLNPQTCIPRPKVEEPKKKSAPEKEEKVKVLYGIEALHMEMSKRYKKQKGKKRSFGVGVAFLLVIAAVAALAFLFL